MENFREKLEEAIKERNTFKKDFIYLIGDDLLAKRLEGVEVRRDYHMGKYLSRKGINVPKFYGIIEVKSENFWAPNEKYLIMELIDGTNFCFLNKQTKKDAKLKQKKELEKVLELGIFSTDAFWSNNVIYGYDENVYLVDFEDYKKGSKEDLEWFRNRIQLLVD